MASAAADAMARRVSEKENAGSRECPAFWAGNVWRKTEDFQTADNQRGITERRAWIPRVVTFGEVMLP